MSIRRLRRILHVRHSMLSASKVNRPGFPRRLEASRRCSSTHWPSSPSLRSPSSFCGRGGNAVAQRQSRSLVPSWRAGSSQAPPGTSKPCLLLLARHWLSQSRCSPTRRSLRLRAGALGLALLSTVCLGRLAFRLQSWSSPPCCSALASLVSVLARPRTVRANLSRNRTRYSGPHSFCAHSATF